MNLDLTIAIPLYNGIKTIPIVLDGLANPNYTGLEHLKVIILDNGSKDGSAEYVDTIIKNKWFHNLTITKFTEPQKPGGAPANIPVVRTRLSNLVDTKYMLYLNHDIVMRPFAIMNLYEDFIKREKCGALSIQYDPVTTHVESGCTIMGTEIARKIKWGFEGQKCDCWFLKEGLTELGLSMDHQENTSARDVHFR